MLVARNCVGKSVGCLVFAGKLNRGLSVVDSLKHLKSGEELTEEEKFLASVLGWCIEWVSCEFINPFKMHSYFSQP